VFFVLADFVSEGVQGQLLGCQLFGETGQSGGLGCPGAVFVDDGAQRRVAVESDPGDSGALRDAGESDRLGPCEPSR
jgi:hypothetical protein